MQESHRRLKAELWQESKFLNRKIIMDYKKSKAPVNTVTRNIMDLCRDTDNIYESVAIIAKRANQISLQIKDDLSKKLAEFASYNDSLEEVFENREQIEISRYYEKLPKATLLATQEFIEDKVYWRDPSREAQNQDI
jgi:DNA-directed RNA polymerase subunit K/omega